MSMGPHEYIYGYLYVLVAQLKFLTCWVKIAKFLRNYH